MRTEKLEDGEILVYLGTGMDRRRVRLNPERTRITVEMPTSLTIEAAKQLIAALMEAVEIAAT